MSTNYYARMQICEKCRRYDELHIGKRSAGWVFSFEAHKDHDMTTYESAMRWLKYERIFDEYGEEVSYDAFREMVEKTGLERRNHAVEYPEGNYVSDGFSFSTEEFS